MLKRQSNHHGIFVTIKVLLSEIALAIDYGQECFLDMDTGEIVSHSDDFDDCSDEDENRKLKCIFFDYNVGYRAMECFIDGLEDERKAEKLLRAISGKGAFGKFRAALDAMDMLDEWYAFKDEFMLEKARKWCRDEGIEYIE